MKGQLLAVLVMSSLALSSCKDNKDVMKLPAAKETRARDDKGSKAKTIEDMQAAFNGESNASARYAAFSKKASEEGYKEIAMLFKAASLSEKIHAENHKEVLKEMGVEVKPAVIDVKVNSTRENLEFAAKGEAYEVAEMYPKFLKDADDSGSQLALISLNYAYNTEKKHKILYEKALAALAGNTVNSLPKTYFVCPTCGNTYENTAPKRCSISMTSGEKFIKVDTL